MNAFSMNAILLQVTDEGIVGILGTIVRAESFDFAFKLSFDQILKFNEFFEYFATRFEKINVCVPTEVIDECQEVSEQ